MNNAAFRVRVPGTTANLGPGFDALGLALGVYNTITAELASETSVVITGEGADSLPRDGRNVVLRAAARACKEARAPMPTLKLVCEHAIPPSRGLGSSASAVVAGLLLGDALSGATLGRDRILELATELEGHPDNAAPAIFGGLQASVHASDGRVHRASVPVHTFPRVVLFVPEFPMPTREARAVLPASLSRADAVFNISRAALLVAALASGRTDLLGVATEDALHQKPREQIFPAMPTLFAAAREAGALAVWLSGAGSTVAAFADDARAADVAAAFERAAKGAGLRGAAREANVDQQGATCERVAGA